MIPFFEAFPILIGENMSLNDPHVREVGGLENTRSFHGLPEEREVNLVEIAQILWKKKWILVAFVLIFSATAAFFSLELPNQYQSQAVLAPVLADDERNMSPLSGQLGGLASLAGFSLSSGNVSNANISLEVLKSRILINQFIDKHDLLVDLFAASSWNEKEKEINIDRDIYDTDSKSWVREVSSGKTKTPTAWEAYERFSSKLKIHKDEKTGLVTVSLVTVSPKMSANWLSWLIDDLNDYLRKQDVDLARKNLKYLQNQINKTSFSEMKQVFYQLIEQQTKKMMLAEVRDQYAFRVIDPPVVPEDKVGPNRIFITLLGAAMGAIFGVACALYIGFRRRIKK